MLLQNDIVGISSTVRSVCFFTCSAFGGKNFRMGVELNVMIAAVKVRCTMILRFLMIDCAI